MAMIPVRELRNHTNDVIRLVRDGDDVTITSNGVPVATLVPIRAGKRASMPKAEFLQLIARHQADPGLTDDLARLAGDTTDDLGSIQ
ncbi:MAG: type II toxin-antitoxin system Phd/YefM family antitoxin [Salinibacterium sp.]|nr:MAG: type II toxin-antitoxin system Phd/YefM family antitoxin [Salinibacterium sp.]